MAAKLDIPVVVVTADIQNTTRKECFELGPAGFVNKPLAEQFQIINVQTSSIDRCKNAPYVGLEPSDKPAFSVSRP